MINDGILRSVAEKHGFRLLDHASPKLRALLMKSHKLHWEMELCDTEDDRRKVELKIERLDEQIMAQEDVRLSLCLHGPIFYDPLKRRK